MRALSSRLITYVALFIVVFSILIYTHADILFQRSIKIYMAYASSIEAIDYSSFQNLYSKLEIGGLEIGFKREGKAESYGFIEFRASIMLNDEALNSTLVRIFDSLFKDELAVNAKYHVNPDVINIKLAMAIIQKPLVKLNFDDINFQATIDWIVMVESNGSKSVINGYGTIWKINGIGVTRAENIHCKQGYLVHILEDAFGNQVIQLRIKEIIDKLGSKSHLKIKLKSTIQYLYHAPKIGFKVKDKIEAGIGEITITNLNNRTITSMTFKTPIIEKEVKIANQNTELIKIATLVIASIACGVLISTIKWKIPVNMK